MTPKVIKTNEEYEAVINRVEEIFDAEPGSPEADELELLSVLIEVYEDEMYPIDFPDPVEAIKFRMEQDGLTRKDLMQYLGSKSKVSEVLNKKRPLSLKMIRSLHEHLGIPPEVLLQKTLTEIPDDDIAKNWQKYPIKEMHKNGYFKDCESPSSDIWESGEELLRSFFSNFDTPSFHPTMYRKGIRIGSNANPFALRAWSAKILKDAKSEDIAKFDRKKIDKDFINQLIRLSVFREGPKLAKEHLERHGIHLIVEKHLPKTMLDGVAMLLPDGSPVIGLTLRYDRIDYFWFSLIHEMAHVVLHLNDPEKDLFIDNFEEPNNSEYEVEADKWAANALIPEDTWKKSKISSITQQSKSNILEFAGQLGISPSIVAGRIRFERKNFRILSNLVGHRLLRNQFFN